MNLLELCIRIDKTLRRRLRMMLFRLRGIQAGRGTCFGRVEIDRPHLVHVGDFCMVGNDVIFNVEAAMNDVAGEPKLIIGSRSHIGTRTIFLCVNKIHIGNNVMIAPGCLFVDNDHGFRSRDIPMRDQEMSTSPIEVRDDVWIGADCKILRGVTIGEGALSLQGL